jgi:hypothetical protein
MSADQIIFDSFKENVNNKVFPYLQKFKFIKQEFKGKNEERSVSFTKEETVLTLSYSLHHLDYQDGIMITLNSKFGKKYLHKEIENKSNKKYEPYSFNPHVGDREFDRILSDIKTCFEKYMLAE